MDREYTEEIKKIEGSLQETLPKHPDVSWWHKVFPGVPAGPERAMPLLEPGQDLFNRGGKRWRPLLAHLVCRALGAGDAALPLLSLVEFPHNASLIHDDLEDNSDERRGKPAIHLLYGSDTAINSGSFLYFLPLTVLENWDGDPLTRLRIWKLWAEHLRLLHLGQSLDIAWHREGGSDFGDESTAYIPSPEEYMLMCGLKTGCLARFAALLGAEIAGSAACPAGGVSAADVITLDKEFTASLGEAAQKLGVGFQILDDVKNLTTGIPGKKRGDDVVEGKKSLPVLLFLQKNDAPDTSGLVPAPGLVPGQRPQFVRRCFDAAKSGGPAVPEVEELIGALEEAGALAEAEKRGKALISQAGAFFSEFPAKDPAAKKLLAGLAEQLL